MALSQPGKETRLRETSLDIDDDSLRELAAEFVRLATDYFANVTEGRVCPNITGEQIKARFDAPPPLAKEPLEKSLADCSAVIDGIRHNGHPRFFGYVASP